MHYIEDPLIKIKLCRFYNCFLSILIIEENNEQKISPEIKIIFIESAINFLLNNIVQNGKEKSEEYNQPLGLEASEAIVELLNMKYYSEKNKSETLVEYIYLRLENYFPIFVQLIQLVDSFSFFIIIEKILIEIKIEKKNLVFECLNNLYNKFKNEFINKKKEKNELYPRMFFQIIIKFLKGINKLNNLDNTEILEFNKIFEKLIDDILINKISEYYDLLIILTEGYIKSLNTINYLSIRILKFIFIILQQDKCTSLQCYNFVSTFLYNLKNNNSNETINQKELLDEIILIIKKSYTFMDEYFLSSKFYALLLTLQILNMNPNISYETLNLLITSSIDCFILNQKEDDNSTMEKTEEDSENIYPMEEIYCINQLCISNISLGFIFKPELTSQILTNKYDEVNKQSNLDKFILYISCYKDIKYPVYNPLLGKCVILGVCSILLNENFKMFLDKNKEKKIFLLKFLFQLIKKSREEKNLIVRNAVIGELDIKFVGKCNEVNEDENEENEYEEENKNDIIEQFHLNIGKALNGDDNNIMKSDEFKYFKKVMEYIKENDNLIYNLIVKDCSNGESNTIEELCLLKNIKIFYKNKEFIVPRKILKINRKYK